jgi:HAD superfamily hydrolase (TIGR01458 family)
VTRLAGLSALLVDLEGTVYEDGRIVPGAAEALAAAAARGIPCAFVTNTTGRPRAAVARELSQMGLDVPVGRIFTAPLAALAYLRRRGYTRCHLLVRPSLREDFPGILADEEAPQVVLLGDMGEETTFARLNLAFRNVLAGAELVTLARNRYWRAQDGLVLDVGVFAAALEYATGRSAHLVGKPSPEFFAAALSALGAAPEQTAVIGDDLESDVGGAQAAGMRGILVRTGKFRASDLDGSSISPDAVLDSLAELPRLL